MTPARSSKNCAGFSLAELVIVLGVVGIILGGLWTALAWGFEAQRQERAKEEIAAVVTAVRSFFLGQANINVTEQQLMNQVVGTGILPKSALRTDQSSCQAGWVCIDSPWGSLQYANGVAGVNPFGTYRIFPWTLGWQSNLGGSNHLYFSIHMSNVNQAACVNLSEYATSSSGPPGAVDLVINQVSMHDNNVFALPPQLATLDTYCKPLAGNTQSVLDIVYTLAQPSF